MIIDGSKEYRELVQEKAINAFWKEVASAYPCIKSGDFSPEETEEFEDACTEAINNWLVGNVKSGYE